MTYRDYLKKKKNSKNTRGLIKKMKWKIDWCVLYAEVLNVKNRQND